MKHRTGYLFKRGSNYYVSWWMDGKLRVKVLRDENGQSITTKDKALQAKAKFMAPYALGSEADSLAAMAAQSNTLKAKLEKQADTMAIARAWTEYLASTKRPDTGPDTLAVYEGQFGQFTTWLEKNHPEVIAMRAVTPKIAEEYAGSINHGKLAAGTYNKHLNVLTLVWRVLQDKASLTVNPWQDMQRKRIVANSRRELTVDELREVCQSAQGEMRLLFALGIYSGLRLKDCATLRWGEVDLVRGVITRIPSKTARRNPKPVIVPVHAALHQMLSEIPKESRGDYVLPKTAETYLTHKKNLINAIQAQFKACKIQIHAPGTGENGKRAVIEVGFHSLRHSFVSMCRAADVPLAVVESIVGHSNPAMTRHYTHTGLPAATRAVATLPAIVGDVKAIKPAPESIVKQLRGIMKGLNIKNLATKKAELLNVLAGV